jgi:hypothetical protein
MPLPLLKLSRGWRLSDCIEGAYSIITAVFTTSYSREMHTMLSRYCAMHVSQQQHL